ncbi:hypothetical protein SAMN05216296_0434 [Pseudomonas pohangensis]|uniref:Z-ring associated protein G n=1 Tax=Pseudomonas pohangensis TaxID=364197 RepID=A0A1H2E660_9PSED|nr:DUF1043 family protein [Pseudomonas pohangensis]SDT90525.1 hypothetical protein SAMN05216296_0434 [Pseudomonas pohangensis]
MEQSYNIWLLLGLALVVGAIIGYFISRQVTASNPERTQQRLDELQQRFDDYQTNVVSHFSTTATLVNRLTQSYQDVQQHLAFGADQLALDELTRERLLDSLRVDATPASNRERLSPPKSNEPPRDYAPKDKDQPGTLDESFGIKSKK